MKNRNTKCLAYWTGFIAMLFAGTAIAQSYEPGHQALEVWNAEAMTNSPQAVKVWLSIMLVSFALGLLFVWKKVEARWAVGGFVLGLLVTKYVLPMTGLVIFSGLVALVHLIFWTPALVILLKKRRFLKEHSLYAYWCGLITLVIIISFVFDLRDAAIYLAHML